MLLDFFQNDQFQFDIYKKYEMLSDVEYDTEINVFELEKWFDFKDEYSCFSDIYNKFT